MESSDMTPTSSEIRRSTAVGLPTRTPFGVMINIDPNLVTGIDSAIIQKDVVLP
jgi:hypothetical protein